MSGPSEAPVDDVEAPTSLTGGGMEQVKQEKLEAAGWHIGTAGEFLGVPPAEIVQPRVEPRPDAPPDEQEPK